MEKEFDFSKAPHQYPLCLNRQCPKAATCLRQIVERNIPSSTVYCNILNPSHLTSLDGDCPYYRSNTKVRYAQGFIEILEHLPYKQMQSAVSALSAFFNRRTYYRVRKGERPLSPTEQEHIIAILRKCGATNIGKFDAYFEDYDW